MSTNLATEYRSIVVDLGTWAADFRLSPDAKISGTGSASTDEPSFVMGNVCVYRSEPFINVHVRVPKSGHELVFVLRPRPGEDAELVGEVGIIGDRLTPDHSTN